MKQNISQAATIAVSLFFLAAISTAPAGSTMLADKDVIVIEDISSWNHPVKKVFAKYSIRVVKVVLFNNKKYPVFHVRFPFEPTEGLVNASVLSSLETELIFANSQYDYAMEDETRNVRIEVAWNKKTRELKENVIPLVGRGQP